MTNQSEQETGMDTTSNRARLIAACDTDANAAAAVQRMITRDRLAAASRTSARVTASPD